MVVGHRQVGLCRWRGGGGLVEGDGCYRDAVVRKFPTKGERWTNSTRGVLRGRDRRREGGRGRYCG